MKRSLRFLCAIAFLVFYDGNANAQSEKKEYEMPPCIAGDLVYHVHPQLTIMGFRTSAKDGRILTPFFITPPANLGVKLDEPRCFREIHTHNYSGVLHVESVDPEREYKLGHFFEVWAERDPLIKRMLRLELIVLVSDTGGERYWKVPDYAVVSGEFLDLSISIDRRKILIILPADAYSSD
ncbi:MAG: hypothetical protein HY456_00510 [Parcubacteria group bacterium]|nr:hypothetical protein [Parcubacteria group bacterium]